MRLFFKGKDGGEESTVTGYWLIEDKKRFSVALVKFEGQSREAYHSHAFNSINWIIWGKGLVENIWKGPIRFYKPGLKPLKVGREVCHKVNSDGTTWVLSFRGPWADQWYEYRPLENNRKVTLTAGRQEV